MKITVQKKNEFIVIAKSYLENVITDPYIKEQIKLRGYDDKRLEEGSALQKIADENRQNQLRIRDKSKSLNKQLQNKLATMLKDFTNDIRLLRSAFFRNIGMKERLHLYGERKRTIPGYLEQARTFYNTILKEQDVLEQLAKLNITNETIQEKLKEINELEKDFIAFKEANKGAQESTDEYNKDYEKLHDWIRVFQNACRIVLKERPQLLEKVGLLVRSTKPRRKGTAAPAAEGTTAETSGEPAAQAAEKKEIPTAGGIEEKTGAAGMGVSSTGNSGSN